MQKVLVRVPEVVRRTGKSRSRLYDEIKLGTFPKPVRIGARAVAWPIDEIDAWIDARIAERDA